MAAVRLDGSVTEGIEKSSLQKLLGEEKTRNRDLAEKLAKALEFIKEKERELEGKNQTIIFQAELLRNSLLASNEPVPSQDEKTQTIERQKQTITSMETVIQKLNETIPVQNQLISQQQISLTHNVKQIKQKFDPNRHNGPRVMTYKVCLKYMENGKGLTRQEIIDLYRKEYRAPDADISRRIYELTTPEYGNLLFIHADDDGRSRFFLTQNPSAEDLAHVGDPFGKKLSPLEGGKPVA